MRDNTYRIVDNGPYPIYTLEKREPGTIMYPIDRFFIEKSNQCSLSTNKEYTDLYEIIAVVKKLNDTWRATLPQEMA